MKLICRKEPSHLPDNYHYFLLPIRVENEMQAAFYELAGHVIVDVDDARGEELLKASGRSLHHQCEVAILVEDELKRKGNS